MSKDDQDELKVSAAAVKSEFLNQFAEAAKDEAVQERIRLIKEQINLALEPIARFQSEYGTKLHALAKVAAKAVEEFSKFETRLNLIHSADKVFLTPYILNLPVNEMKSLFDSIYRSAIEVYVEVFQDEDHINALISEWTKSEVLTGRIPILTAALKAHVSNQHELSIPVFLCQIEGILLDFLSARRHGQFEAKLREKFPDKRTEDLDTYFAVELFIEVICEEIFASTGDLDRKTEKAKYPNRHEILHGKDLTYYLDSHASTRCIIVLDFLRSEQFVNQRVQE